MEESKQATPALKTILNSLNPVELVEARDHIQSLLTSTQLQIANQQLSPLLQLPPDILHFVIEFALTYNTDIDLEDDDLATPGILQTCHKLRNEAMKPYLHNNTFSMKRSFQENRLEHWAKEILREHRKHVKRIRLGPPLHCSNEEATKEAKDLDERCGWRAGTVWVLSEDDFENDYEWWVNGLGETEKIQAVSAESSYSSLSASSVKDRLAAESAIWSWCSRVSSEEVASQRKEEETEVVVVQSPQSYY
ncbi:unnamed protein product [Zymoseptoria tritici ST99CH_1A5]|uniref:Uncharacterized protein n=2 Tax=Zymoseptoria tritici TaxID=1047171 RepID=A0A1X7RJ41_ZYMT9|nr:unnamed protein product [Zymoseptoria tritici ST99CH_3D7]SMR47224.1 unnamed protein product [Zymoseptoria tritici ST99CH_3D1]SMY21121.1 unnamed protein product [Zymoseptoria tritici ST99CH_1A5]